MSAKNEALNNCLTSRKRKAADCQEIGSSSKRTTLELFPTCPQQQQEFIDDSHILGPDYHLHTYNGGDDQIFSNNNVQSSTSLLNDGPNLDEDFLEKLFRSQYENMKETFSQYFNYKYNDILRLAEETAAKRLDEKATELGEMRAMLDNYREKVGELSTQVEALNDTKNDKNTELKDIRARNMELLEKEAQSKSEAQVWKAKAEKAEQVLRKCRCHSSSTYGHDHEDDVSASLTSVGNTPKRSRR